MDKRIIEQNRNYTFPRTVFCPYLPRILVNLVVEGAYVRCTSKDPSLHS